jgi:hypothetical protein
MSIMQLLDRPVPLFSTCSIPEAPLFISCP